MSDVGPDHYTDTLALRGLLHEAGIVGRVVTIGGDKATHSETMCHAWSYAAATEALTRLWMLSAPTEQR